MFVVCVCLLSPLLLLCSGCLVLVVSGPTQYTSERVDSWRSLHTSQPKAYVDASWQNTFLQSMNFTSITSVTCDDGDSAWKVSMQISIFSNFDIHSLSVSCQGCSCFPYVHLFDMCTYVTPSSSPVEPGLVCSYALCVCVHVHSGTALNKVALYS